MNEQQAQKTFDWTLKDWEDTKVSNKKELLKTLLKEKTWEEIEQLDAIRALAWGFKTTQQCYFNDIMPSEQYWDHYRNTLFDWLKICVSSKPDKGYYFNTRILKGKCATAQHSLDRETCIKELIKDDEKLDKFFFYPPENRVLDKEGELHLRFLITWFIRRYDLGTAWWLIRKLARHLPSDKVHPDGVGLKASCRWYFWRLLGFLGIFLIVLLPVWLGYDLPPFFLATQVSGSHESIQSLLFRIWYQLVIVVVFLFFIVVSFMVCSNSSSTVIDAKPWISS